MDHLYLNQMRTEAGISLEDMAAYISDGLPSVIDIAGVESGKTKLSFSQYLKWFYFSSTTKIQKENFFVLTRPGVIFSTNSSRLYCELTVVFLCVLFVTFSFAFVF